MLYCQRKNMRIMPQLESSLTYCTHRYTHRHQSAILIVQLVILEPAFLFLSNFFHHDCLSKKGNQSKTSSYRNREAENDNLKPAIVPRVTSSSSPHILKTLWLIILNPHCVGCDISGPEKPHPGKQLSSAVMDDPDILTDFPITVSQTEPFPSKMRLW